MSDDNSVGNIISAISSLTQIIVPMLGGETVDTTEVLKVEGAEVNFKTLAKEAMYFVANASNSSCTADGSGNGNGNDNGNNKDSNNNNCSCWGYCPGACSK
tara:strand:- start:63 stop:365 length:303 start_codon:yes stop_codon:yes gene_type:complete